MGHGETLLVIRRDKNNQPIQEYAGQNLEIPQQGEVIELGETDFEGNVRQKSSYQVVERSFGYFLKPNSEGTVKIDLFVKPL